MLNYDEIEFMYPGQDHSHLPRSEESTSGKSVVTNTLKFGIDIDGTISMAPKHFKRLIEALENAGNLVYIVTARDAGRREETEEFLQTLGIHYHSMIMKPIDWPGTIPEYKVSVVLDKDMHMLIDDEEPNCWAVQQQTRALASHVLPIPEMLEEFRDLWGETVGK